MIMRMSLSEPTWTDVAIPAKHDGPIVSAVLYCRSNYTVSQVDTYLLTDQHLVTAQQREAQVKMLQ